MAERYVDGICLISDVENFNNCKEKYLLKDIEYIGRDDYCEDDTSTLHIFIMAIPQKFVSQFRKESFVEAFDINDG